MAVSIHVLLVLVFLHSDVARSDNIIGTSVLQRGKDCIQVAREAYELIKDEADDADTTSEVITHLEALTEDARHLQRSAEQFLSNFVSEEEDLATQLQLLQTEKNKFEIEIEASKREKGVIESRRSAKESVLRDNEHRLQQAQKEWQDAENELHRAKKKLKKKSKGIFGKIKKAFGMLDKHKKKVKRAQSNLDRQKSEFKSAQAVTDKAQQELSTVKDKIQQQDQNIQATQQQVNIIHDKIGVVRNSISLLRKSVHFWKLFVVASERAEGRTEALKTLFNQATEEGDYELLKEDGTITRANSFIEAWDMIASDHRIQ
jgi:chromosome segregation ATPase